MTGTDAGATDLSGTGLGGTDLGGTESLCPVCLRVLPAAFERRGEEVLLVRTCPEHGLFSEAVWRGEPDFAVWRRPKHPAKGVLAGFPHDRGCPFDCGLCPEHAQLPCTILLEITDRCDLGCPVCFASSGAGDKPHGDIDKFINSLEFVRKRAGSVVLQISGGEPTLHPRLTDLVRAAAKLFPAVQLNTNGLRLAADPDLAVRLKEAGLGWVFLQFDSLDDETLKILRGRALKKEKIRAVDNLERAGLPAVLVPTVARGVNDMELGGLVRFGVARPMVRGLHFQPMTTSGRNSLGGAERRLTLPELLRGLCAQTPGLDMGRAFPPGCEHERCSFHLRFRRLPDGTLVPRPGGGESACCCSPGAPPKTTQVPSDPGETAAGRDRAVDIILRSWSPGGVGQGAEPGRENPGAPGPTPLIPMAKKAPDAFDEFLDKAARESFSLTAMAFQDVWTADLARLRGCCVHVFSPPDRFVPFCAMNLTSADGRALYR
ncbi:MAG: radical SAM protein [Deltaproteobacteria bacterium]|jgi:uncharacterized radical SAM superfamily Fe-S cluster-containing enzyme|nr:radical SAM protein [Deltaproteobacteria bacterium]